jgi:hypothetical protein
MSVYPRGIRLGSILPGASDMADPRVNNIGFLASASSLFFAAHISSAEEA